MSSQNLSNQKITAGTESYSEQLVTQVFENDLFKDNTLLNHILNEIPIRVFWKDLNSVFLGCNQIFAEDAGESKPADIIGYTDFNFWPEQAEAFREDDQYVISTGESKIKFEESQTRSNGSTAYLMTTKIPLKNDKGEIYGVLGMYEDITERKKTESLLSNNAIELEQIFKAIPEALVYANAERNVVYINPGFTRIFGYNYEEVQGKKTDSFYKSIDDYTEQIKQRFNPHVTQTYDAYEVEYRRKNGEIFLGETVGTSVKDSAGNIIGYIGLIRDITDRKHTEKAIAKQKNFLQRVIDSSPNYIFVKDRESRFVLVNKALAEAYGSNVKDLIGKSDFDFNPNKEEAESFHQDDLHVIDSQEEKIIPEEKITTANGGVRWLQTVKRPIIGEDEMVNMLLGVSSDITERKKTEELLTYQATYDDLTGLVNRREFERRIQRLLSTNDQENKEHALCFMDLDQFKVINDTCGHIAGDEMLRQLSSELIRTVRHRDTLARLGGDEFGILMEHCSLDDAYRVATAVQKAIQEYQFSWDEHIFKVGVSIGLVPITENNTDMSELLREADVACYMAKDRGRNRIHIYDLHDSETTQRDGEVRWVTKLTKALDEDRFCLYAQAIVPLDGSSGLHYELLLRMIDKQGEIIPPNAFLPSAEHYNMASKIDHWVIDHAFKYLARNPNFLEQIDFCSINLSGQSLTTTEILDFIIRKLDELNIDGKKICFEITETSAISNLSMASKFISTLNTLGCQFALDDFGSGLSSFGYLKNLHVDYLKIDGMFVKDIVDDDIDKAMVKSINEIGHVMGKKTIAEFVENDEIKQILIENGIDFAQGYGLGKPKPLHELLKEYSSKS